VLVVEDDDQAREALGVLLEEAGAHVVTARDGWQALLILDGVVPDLILCAAAMPRMGGLTFAQVVRADPLIPKTPIVAMTAATDDAAHLQTMMAGFDVHVAKPVDVEALGAVLRRLSPDRRSSASS
jgi:CheY-like chemotaxis protein